jgi:hypothetical protein
MSSIKLGLLKENETYRKGVIVKFSSQPSQSGGKRKGIVLICLTLYLQLTELHMRYKFHPMNPNKKHIFSKSGDSLLSMSSIKLGLLKENDK